jgi:hypothetical protein
MELRMSWAAVALTAFAVVLWGPAAHGTAQSTSACVVPERLGVVFVLDDSGSMTSNDPADLRAVAAGIGLDALADGSIAAAVKFTSAASTLFAPRELVGDVRTQLKGTISAGLFSSGGTAYEPAFVRTLAELDAMPATVDRKAVVFLSDGQPNDLYSADQQIAARGIPIFTVAFGAADRTQMAGIAARSGGQAYDVASPGEAQAAFARIVSRLTCDNPQVSEQVDLEPGQTATFPFVIEPTDREFRALAAWESGDVKVELVRPRDLGVLDAQSQLAGETFDDGDTFVQARAIDPAAGGWKLQVTASTDNLARVAVSIDVFKRLTTDPPDAPRLTAPRDGATIDSAEATVEFTAPRGARSYAVIVDGEVHTEVDAPATEAEVTLAGGSHELYVEAVNEYGRTPSNRVRVTAPGGPGDPSDPGPGPGSGPAPTDLELLRQYMPRLFLDDKEDYAPIDAEDFLLREGTELCSDVSKTICLYPQPLLSSIGRMSALSDLGLANTTRSWLDFDEGDRRGEPRIFGHVVAPTLDVPYRFLDYWWFFANNNYPIGPWWDHRGDWEGVYVAVPPRPGAGFDWVGFDGHGHATRYLPQVLRCASAGGTSESAVHEQECGEDARRVNAYAAHGSHATYPRRCGRNLIDVAGGLLGPPGSILNSSCMQTRNDKGILPEGDFNGKRAFAGNERPESTMKLLPSAGSTWPFWRGHWGDPEGGEQSPGPRSPGLQARFRNPLTATSCTDRWVGANNKYACGAASVRAAAARSSDIDECDPWFGPGIAVAVCDAAAIRAAIATGTVATSTPGIDGAGAANANGVAQVAGMLTPASPLVRIVAASGVVYARAVSGRQAVEALYDARPGGLVIRARRDGLGRPLLRVRDRQGGLVAPRASYALHVRPLSRPRVQVRSRGTTLVTLRVRGASSVRVAGAGVRDGVRRVRAGRVRLTVPRATRSLQVAAVGRGRVSSRPVTVRLPRARRGP